MISCRYGGWHEKIEANMKEKRKCNRGGDGRKAGGDTYAFIGGSFSEEMSL